MDSYIDLANRREIYIQRFASHLRNEYLYTSIDEAYKQARLILLDTGDIKSLKARDKVMQLIKGQVKPVTAEAWVEINKELNDYAEQEATYYAAMFGAVNEVSMSVPATDKVQEYIRKATMSLESSSGAQAGKWSEFITANSNSVYSQINDQIKIGYRNEESASQMIKRVKRISDGMLRNQAEALVRTGVAHFATNARRAMVNDNLDIIDWEIPSVTFDNRITRICISISANYSDGWPVNKSPIGYPGYHFGCRTTILYLVKGQREIDGTKAFVGGKKGKDAEDSFNNRNTRLDNKRNNPDNLNPVASKVRRKGNRDKAFSAGQIKATTPLAEFLKTQPFWFVESTLESKTLAQAFMDGKLDLRKLTDKNLKPLTLKEIGLR